MDEFYCVPLEPYCNHKGIGEKEMMDDIQDLEHVSIDGGFLKPASLPNSFEMIMIEGVSFTFPKKEDVTYDHIMCDEQVIEVEPDKYQSLHVIGFGVYGDYKEKIIVQFSDQTQETVEIYLYDWFKFNSMWEFNLRKPYTIALTVEPTIYYNECFIYYDKGLIKNHEKTVTKIIMPCNPNLHLFGITLQKVK